MIKYVKIRRKEDLEAGDDFVDALVLDVTLEEAIHGQSLPLLRDKLNNFINKCYIIILRIIGRNIMRERCISRGEMLGGSKAGEVGPVVDEIVLNRGLQL